MPEQEPVGPQRKTVLLDRDGTVSQDRGYTCRPEDMKIFPGAGAAVSKLHGAGFAIAVVTNQSAIGRGLASEDDVRRTNAECLAQLLAEDADAKVDRVVFCPHTPEAGCECRKPKTGLVRELGWSLSPEQSWMIGDKCLDLEFGRNAGLAAERCLLVLTGEGSAEEHKARKLLGTELRVFADLGAAARHIIESE